MERLRYLKNASKSPSKSVTYDILWVETKRFPFGHNLFAAPWKAAQVLEIDPDTGATRLIGDIYDPSDDSELYHAFSELLV